MNVVYYAANANGSQVKIGFTSNLTQRLNSLKSLYGEVSLLAWEPGSKDVELRRHITFYGGHIHGEWFSPSDDLLAHVRALPSATGLSAEERESMMAPKSDLVRRTIRDIPSGDYAALKLIAHEKRWRSVNTAILEAIHEYAARHLAQKG